VGDEPSAEVKTIREAAVLAEKDQNITRVFIFAGTYKESVTFRNLRQDLSIEGVSNDSTTGTRIIAPPLKNTALPLYATLRFINVKKVKLSFVHLSGAGHGVFAARGISIHLSHLFSTGNVRTGATLVNIGEAVVENCQFSDNGNFVAVNINNQHYPVVENQIAVNINNQHKGSGQIAVNINNQHRPYDESRFGLVIEGSREVFVDKNLFAKNYNGGLAVFGPGQVAVNINNQHKGTGQIAVNINNQHRVIAGSQIAVNINNQHKVVGKGNRFANNGPVSFHRGRLSTGQCGQCSPGSYCQGTTCQPKLSVAHEQLSGAKAIMGVGAVIAGMGDVQLTGNSFFRNDATGLIVHSIKDLTLSNNAISRNGVRPESTLPNLLAFALPAIHLWNIHGKVDVNKNLIAENVSVGLQVSNFDHKGMPAMLKINANANHITGNGVFLSKNESVGDGIKLMTELKGSNSIEMNVYGNVFMKNRRSGFASHGAIRGSLEGNLFRSHPGRALALHDTGFQKDNTIKILKNTIQEAFGYGIQIYGGTEAQNSDAKIELSGNRIDSVKSLKTMDSSKEMPEADGVSLVNLSIANITIKENLFAEMGRAAVFMHSSKATAEGNQIDSCTYGFILQHNASLTRDSDVHNKDSMSTPSNESDVRSPSSTGGMRYNNENWTCQKDW
tara:strand:- start:8727 stop:10739 length:2013 start_codon:yes stop_codon:yes gene_type:complete